MLSLAYMKDFSAELMDILKWMLARHSSIMNWGMLCLAYLKDFGVDGCIEVDVGPVLVHHELGHVVVLVLHHHCYRGEAHLTTVVCCSHCQLKLTDFLSVQNLSSCYLT